MISWILNIFPFLLSDLASDAEMAFIAIFSNKTDIVWASLWIGFHRQLLWQLSELAYSFCS